MSLPPLDNLVRVGKLKAEPAAQLEFEGLVRSGTIQRLGRFSAAQSSHRQSASSKGCGRCGNLAGSARPAAR